MAATIHVLQQITNSESKIDRVAGCEKLCEDAFFASSSSSSPPLLPVNEMASSCNTARGG